MSDVMHPFLQRFIMVEEGEVFHEIPTWARHKWFANETTFPPQIGFEVIGYIENYERYRDTHKPNSEYINWIVGRSGTYPRILRAWNMAGELKREINYDL